MHKRENHVEAFPVSLKDIKDISNSTINSQILFLFMNEGTVMSEEAIKIKRFFTNAMQSLKTALSIRRDWFLLMPNKCPHLYW